MSAETMDVDRITLAFADNGSLHHDLVLRIGAEETWCDAYFLWCEGMSNADSDHVHVVRAMLARLIQQWLHAVSELATGKRCFLPFDFSDQCTAWLCCSLDASGMIVVQRGWSLIEGWSISISNIGAWLFDVPDFKPDGVAVRISREALLRSLSSCIAMGQ